MIGRISPKPQVSPCFINHLCVICGTPRSASACLTRTPDLHDMHSTSDCTHVGGIARFLPSPDLAVGNGGCSCTRRICKKHLMKRYAQYRIEIPLSLSITRNEFQALCAHYYSAECCRRNRMDEQATSICTHSSGANYSITLHDTGWDADATSFQSCSPLGFTNIITGAKTAITHKGAPPLSHPFASKEKAQSLTKL